VLLCLEDALDRIVLALLIPAASNKENGMKLKFLSLLAVLILAPLAMQSADAKKRDYTQRLSLVTQFAGEEVPYVRFGLPRTAYRWESLGDEAILVWHTRHKAYLVDLEKSGSCRDLSFEYAIKLENSVNDLDSRSGYIQTRYGAGCKMTKIRPVDVAALKKAEALERQNKTKT
jgi:Family of unknown function (DUF6491)